MDEVTRSKLIRFIEAQRRQRESWLSQRPDGHEGFEWLTFRCAQADDLERFLLDLVHSGN